MIPLLSERRLDIGSLCERYSVAEMDVFGSAARGDFEASRSDVDLAVRFKPLSPREYRDCYFSLLFSLEDLLKRSVELVDLDAQSNPVFKESIESEKQVLYAA
ncbi:MAG: nucleotidyltransferase family protein [Fimbriimonas sp.]